MAPKRPTAERSWSTDSSISPFTTAQQRKPNAPADSFNNASLQEYLDLDDRPTFVISLVQTNGGLEPVCVNNALLKHSDLRTVVEACLRRCHEHPAFIAWLMQPTNKAENSSTQWNGKQWKRAVVGGKWVVVHCCGPVVTASPSTNQRSSGVASATKLKSVSSPTKHVSPRVEPETPLVDWTHESVTCSNQYIQSVRDYDWASTPLGPMKSWPWHLRSSFHTLMADPFPGIMYWGSQNTLIYNEACMQIIGQKHPTALGGDASHEFDELWPQLKRYVTKVRNTGKASVHQNQNLPLLRQSLVEETYWTYTLLPVVGADGRVTAVYSRFLETTSLNISERRQMTLAKLSELGSSSKSLEDLWKQILKALDFNTQTPFAAIYSVSNDEEGAEDSTSSFSTASQSKICELQGSFGFPEGQSKIPQTIDLQEGEHALASALRQAWRANKPIFLQKSDGTLPNCINLKKPIRGYDHECASAVIFPVRFPLENSLVAFVVHGLNPRRPYDDDYKGYLTLLQARTVELAANIHLPDEERRMQTNLREETLRQASLASRLLSRTHEAEQKQQRFKRIAENAPIGIALYDAESKPIFFNNAYFEMTGQSKENFGPSSWVNAIHEDDVESVSREWRKLTEEGIPVTIQHRVKQPWRSIDPVDGSEIVGEKWLLSSAFPEITGDDPNTPSQIMGWTIDISHQKWAERLQRQRLEDALENKRQSENFIDMTSHEMRNPLSAILQSADGINAALTLAMEEVADSHALEHLNSIGENAQTIILCAQHQKRIVDDILTLSKLDSNLLLITPDRTDPVAILRHVLKMYEAELLNLKIEAKLFVDPSYQQHDIEFVLLDPSRLLQVLINLLTNAIKFTQHRDQRTITLSISASRAKPSSGPNGIDFFPINPSRAKTNGAKRIMCAEDPVYLTFSVQDSGRGLSDEEKKVLFHRFAQANPRTHVQYGGSGLGLFISRELTELQGGQIGVASELGKGSTFAFYIRACRVTGASPDEKNAWGRASAADRLGLPFTELPIRSAPTPPPTSRTTSVPDAGRLPNTPGSPLKTPSHGLVSNPIDRRGSSIKEGAGINVLVVEDNVINQRVMAKQLSSIGCTVHVANHGAEALAFIRGSRLAVQERSDSGCDVYELDVDDKQDRPRLDIIFMDLEMPVMDGLTCVRRIRSLQHQRRIVRYVPIICITANAREAQIEEARNVGCDLVVTKPFRIPELMPQMKRLIEELR